MAARKNSESNVEQLILNLEEDQRLEFRRILDQVFGTYDVSHNIHLLFKQLYASISKASARRHRWKFAMINPSACARVMKAILDGDAPFVTMKVWEAARCHVVHNSGHVALNRAQLAKQARTNAKEVGRAMLRLQGYGAVRVIQKGRTVSYWIDPRVGWAGEESERQRQLADLLQSAQEIVDRERAEPGLPIAAE